MGFYYRDSYSSNTNLGAIIKYDGKGLNIKQFSCSSHPYYLPKFMDAFDWSLPFLGENMSEIILALLQLPKPDSKMNNLSEEDKSRMREQERARQEAVRAKIKSIGRISHMFQNVRNERESLSELANAIGTDVVPSSYLTLGHEELIRAINSFSDAKLCDAVNEIRPSSNSK